jgi:hypothetical protein
METPNERFTHRARIAFGVGGFVAAGLIFYVATRPVFPKPDYAFLRGSEDKGHVVAEDGSLEAYVFELPRPYREAARAAKSELTPRGYTFGYFGRDKTHFFRDRGGVTVERGTVVQVSPRSGLPQVDQKGAGTVVTFFRYVEPSHPNPDLKDL